MLQAERTEALAYVVINKAKGDTHDLVQMPVTLVVYGYPEQRFTWIGILAEYWLAKAPQSQCLMTFDPTAEASTWQT